MSRSSWKLDFAYNFIDVHIRENRTRKSQKESISDGLRLMSLLLT